MDSVWPKSSLQDPCPLCNSSTCGGPNFCMGNAGPPSSLTFSGSTTYMDWASNSGTIDLLGSASTPFNHGDSEMGDFSSSGERSFTPSPQQIAQAQHMPQAQHVPLVPIQPSLAFRDSNPPPVSAPPSLQPHLHGNSPLSSPLGGTPYIYPFQNTPPQMGFGAGMPQMGFGQQPLNMPPPMVHPQSIFPQQPNQGFSTPPGYNQLQTHSQFVSPPPRKVVSDSPMDEEFDQAVKDSKQGTAITLWGKKGMYTTMPQQEKPAYMHLLHNVILTKAASVAPFKMHIKSFTCIIYFPAEVTGNFSVERIWFGNEDAIAVIHHDEITVHNHSECREVRVKVHEQDSYSPQEETSNSWTKKIVHRVDGTKNNVRKLLEKTNDLVVCIRVEDPQGQAQIYACSKKILTIALSSFDNAIKQYRDDGPDRDSLIALCKNELGGPTCLQRKLDPSAKRVRRTEIDPRSNHELDNEVIDSFSTRLQSCKKPDDFRKLFWSEPWYVQGCSQWERIIDVLNPNVTFDMNMFKSILIQIFDDNFYYHNIPTTCCSQYFGGILDPKEVLTSMEKVMRPNPTTAYPGGCVLFVIWKKPSESQWCFYLIESPVYDLQAQRFRNRRNLDKPGDFPYSLKKMVLQQDKLILADVPLHAQQTFITLGQMEQQWGQARLPRFNLVEDDLVTSLSVELRSM